MILDLDYVYDAQVRFKRKKPEEKAFLSKMRVSVAEIDKGDAPVVARYLLPMGDRFRYSASPPPRVREELRVIDGRLFVPHRTSRGIHDGADDTPLDAAWLEQIAKGGQSAWPNPFSTVCNWSRGRLTSLEEVQGEIAEVLVDGRPEAEAKARGIASRLALIDGRLWIEIAEPRIRLEVERGRLEDSIPYVLTVISGVKPGEKDNYADNCQDIYRLDQAPYIREMLSRMPEDLNVRIDDSELEVLDASCFRYPADELLLLQSARKFIDFHKKYASDLSIDDFSAYAHLRDALKDYPEEWGGAPFPEMEGFVDLMEVASRQFEGRIAADTLSLATMRWRQNRREPEAELGLAF